VPLNSGSLEAGDESIHRDVHLQSLGLSATSFSSKVSVVLSPHQTRSGGLINMHAQHLFPQVCLHSLNPSTEIVQSQVEVVEEVLWTERRSASEGSDGFKPVLIGPDMFYMLS